MAFFLPPVIAAGSTILAGVGGVAAYVQSKMNELDKKIATMAKATRDIERSAELATTGGNIWSELLKPFASEIGPGLKTAGNAICALAVGTLLIGVYALFEARDPSLGPHAFSRVIVSFHPRNDSFVSSGGTSPTEIARRNCGSGVLRTTSATSAREKASRTPAALARSRKAAGPIYSATGKIRNHTSRRETSNRAIHTLATLMIPIAVAMPWSASWRLRSRHEVRITLVM